MQYKKYENSSNYQNENECKTYLSSCTTDTQKFKAFNCEYLTYTTDDECKLAGQIRRTNGVNCAKRETCERMKAETCYCTKRICESAPLTLITESDCQQYFTLPKRTCTTKKNGGYITKSSCIAASIQSACVQDSLELNAFGIMRLNNVVIRDAKIYMVQAIQLVKNKNLNAQLD